MQLYHQCDVQIQVFTNDGLRVCRVWTFRVCSGKKLKVIFSKTTNVSVIVFDMKFTCTNEGPGYMGVQVIGLKVSHKLHWGSFLKNDLLRTRYRNAIVKCLNRHCDAQIQVCINLCHRVYGVLSASPQNKMSLRRTNWYAVVFGMKQNCDI